MAYYSTLQEAYNIESFENKKRVKKSEGDTIPEPFQQQSSKEKIQQQSKDSFQQQSKERFQQQSKDSFQQQSKDSFQQQSKERFQQQSKERFQQHKEKFMNDYSTQDDCYYKKFNLNMNSCPDNSKLSPNTDFCDKFTNNDNSCSPLQAPTYEYPISEEAKKGYDKALNTALNTTNSNQISYDEFNKLSNIKDVKPYYDDDFEQYLDIKNFKNQINYQSSSVQSLKEEPVREEPLPPRKEPLKEILLPPRDEPLPIKDNSEKNNKKKDQYYKNLINIGLFTFIGIVIILLCDQIAEIAINIGMKKTMQLLEPYLEKIHNAQIANSQITNAI